MRFRSGCSERQGELISQLVEPGGLVQILSDGDEADQRCAECIFGNVASSRAVRWLRLEEGKQPTDLSADALEF